MKTRLIVLLMTLLTTGMVTYSLPRFASRTNLPCQSCHVNPSGAGMRNAYGLEFGRERLSMKSWRKEFDLEQFSANITDNLSYGADFRFLAFYRSKSGANASSSSFFPMQTDVYFNLAVSKKISFYLNPAFGPYNRLEAFAIARILPQSGYVKAGRFAPPYGTRLDDHTSFVRQSTPFRNNAGQQSGIEIGINPSPFSVMGAVTNGMRGDIDRGLAKAIFGKLEGRSAFGPVNLQLGVSTYNDASGGEKLNLLGVYGAATFMERLTVTGTAERIRGNSVSMSISSDRNQRNSGGADLKQLAVLLEADYLLTEGIDLKVMYDFFDPNTDFKSGSAARYSAGIEFIPVSGVEVRPLLRYTEDAVLGRNTTEVDVLFHIYL